MGQQQKKIHVLGLCVSVILVTMFRAGPASNNGQIFGEAIPNREWCWTPHWGLCNINKPACKRIAVLTQTMSADNTS